MSTQELLRQEAANTESFIERLTRDIEQAEARIVDLRRRRDEARLHRAESLAAADVLDNIGFRVEPGPGSGVTVRVDPPHGPDVPSLVTVPNLGDSELRSGPARL